MLALLWSIQRILEPGEVQEKVQHILETVDNIPDLSVRDESIALVLLKLIEQKDKAITKSIKKRLNKLGKRHPRLFRGILPLEPRGARRRKKKR
jgi:hypothetical protein